MRLVFAQLALLSVLVPASVSAAPSRLSEQASREDILGWINNYRHKPEPDRMPTAVRALSRLGLLTDSETAGVYAGFVAGVLGANPERADVLVARMFPLRPEHQWLVVRAIAYSGLKDWQKLLARHAERMPSRRAMIDKFTAGMLPTLDQAPIEKDETWGEKVRGQLPLAKYFAKPKTDVALDLSPDLLDTLWGHYYATGHYRPLSRIILMTRWHKERDVLEKLTLGSVSKYTLAINASRNADLLATLKWASTQQQPEGVQAALKDAIEAAETLETGKLRAEANASIEEFKRKGPGIRRDISLWGQVGEGALALGCIAAAITAQVEFALPCVIGGAATSAALRMWDSQK